MTTINPASTFREKLCHLASEQWSSQLVTTHFLYQVNNILFKADTQKMDSALIEQIKRKCRHVCLRYSNATQLMKACLISSFVFGKKIIFQFPDGKFKAYPKYVLRALALESPHFKKLFEPKRDSSPIPLRGLLSEELDLLLKYIAVSHFDASDPNEPSELFPVPGEHAVFTYEEKMNVLRIATDFDMQRIKCHVESKLQKEKPEEYEPSDALTRLSHKSPLDLRYVIHLMTSKPSEEVKDACENYISFFLSSRFPECASPILKKIRKGGIRSFTLYPMPYSGSLLPCLSSKLKGLAELYLNNGKSLTPEELESIFKFRNLKILDLSGCELVDDSFISQIKRLSTLEHLSLRALPRMTSQGIYNLGVIHFELTDEGLVELKPLPRLHHLELDRKELLVYEQFDFSRHHPKVDIIYN